MASIENPDGLLEALDTDFGGVEEVSASDASEESLDEEGRGREHERSSV